MTMGQSTLFSKKTTSMLHGLAILMMIYHHLFINGNHWCLNEGASLFDILEFMNPYRSASMQLLFAWFCKICVAVFAFTSGYGICAQLDKKCDGTYRSMYGYCFRRLWSFYKQFMIAFLFFNGYQLLFDNSHGFDYSFLNFILNMLGLRTSYNATLWYVPLYYCMILLSPLFYAVLNGKISFRLVVWLAIAGIFCSATILCYAYMINDLPHYLMIFSNLIQSPFTIYMTVFFEGMACCRFLILDKISRKMGLLTNLLLLTATFVLRTMVIRVPGDYVFDIMFIIPFILSVSGLMSYSKYLSTALCRLGNYSSYMWYSHPYFYSYLFFGFIRKSDISLFVYAQVVLYSMTTSLFFSFVEKNLDKLCKNIIRKETTS